MKLFASLMALLLCQTVGYSADVYGLSSSYNADLDLYGPTQLFRFDLHGNTFADLGSLLLDGTTGDFDGLAASRESGLVAFQFTPAGSRLVQVDPGTSTATLLAPPLFGREIRGATFSTAGALWAVDASLDQLVSVSPMTGEALGAVSLNLDSQSFDVPLATDLTYNFSGQLILLAKSHAYLVDPLTGEMIAHFSDSAGEPIPPSPLPPALVGAVVGYGGAEKLFALDVEGDSADDIYSYDLSGGFGREHLFVGSLPEFDAALGDLALLERPVESGDYNGNGVVDTADYTIWRDTIGAMTQLAANGNDSGTSMSIIDDADYGLWVRKFGSLAAAGSSARGAAVPEPSHLILLLLIPLLRARK